MRLEPELAERAQALVDKLGGIPTRAAILREAMKEGLSVLEERYGLLPVRETTAPAVKKGKAPRATRR